MSLFVTCASFYASSLIFLQKTSRKSKKIKKPRRKSKKIKKKQKTQKYLTLRTRSLRVTSSSEKIVFYEFKEVFKTQRRFLFMNKIKKQNIMTRCKKFKTIMQFGRVQTRKHVIIFFLQSFKMLFSPPFFWLHVNIPVTFSIAKPCSKQRTIPWVNFSFGHWNGYPEKGTGPTPMRSGLRPSSQSILHLF